MNECCKEAIANYKKELREKAKEKLDLIVNGAECIDGYRLIPPYRDGQKSVFLWIERELRGD